MLNVVTCDDVALANILVIVKRVLSLVQIIGPILCIVGLIYTFIKMSINPDEKKNTKRIVNIVLALVIMFFVPVIVNATMGLMGESTDFSSCWNAAPDTIKANNVYIEDDEGQGNSIGVRPEDYTYDRNSNSNSNEQVGSVSSEGGSFSSDRSNGIYGTMVSSIDGKKHIIYNQVEISGWGSNCNRAAAASIASAYTSDTWEPVNYADQVGQGIGYYSNATSNYFSHFGLNSTVTNMDGKTYNSIKDGIISNLSKGNYVMFDLSNPNVYGKSGQKWTSTRHWLAILDIKRLSDGNYAIFVSDSGHGGSVVDKVGLGAGWYKIDEFDGQPIATYTVISKK